VAQPGGLTLGFAVHLVRRYAYLATRMAAKNSDQLVLSVCIYVHSLTLSSKRWHLISVYTIILVVWRSRRSVMRTATCCVAYDSIVQNAVHMNTSSC